MMGSASTRVVGSDAGSGLRRGLVDVSEATAAARRCARPGCSEPARATLGFAYAQRTAVIEPLSEERAPQAYDLCGRHASVTRPPRGWTLQDDRPIEAPSATRQGTPSDEALGGDGTVAILAAALRAVPDAPSTSPTEASTEAPTRSASDAVETTSSASRQAPDPATRPVLAARERGA